MRRWIAIVAVVALVVAGVAFAANFLLTKTAETNNSITFSYPQQAGADGYRYYAPGTLNGTACAGTAVSRTLDPTRTSIKFGKISSGQYCVEAIVLTPIGAAAYPSGGDTTPPTVTVTSPVGGSTVSGTINVSSTATDAGGIQNVTFQVDGTTVGNDTVAPYSVSFDTTTVANGPHTFGSRAADTAGNVGAATNVTATVSNDAEPPPTGQCDTTTPNVPGGPDGNGGCFPGLANTGPNAPASSMATYTGSCTISTANVTIDSKVVNCRTLVVASGGGGFKLTNSYLNGGIVQSGGNAQFTVSDSFIDSGVQYPACSNGGCPAGKYACGDPNNQTTDCGVTGANYTILRTEIINSNRAAYCFTNCLVQDNYFHGTNLWPDPSNKAHASSMREEQNLTLRHNSLHCSYTGPFVNSEIGCSADLTGYPDFTAIKNNTVDGNLFVASIGSGFCAYGGNTQGKPFSSDPTNATNQKFTNNVFQRGSNNKCAAFGPITDFSTSRSGNVWSNNKWSDGTTVNPA